MRAREVHYDIMTLHCRQVLRYSSSRASLVMAAKEHLQVDGQATLSIAAHLVCSPPFVCIVLHLCADALIDQA